MFKTQTSGKILLFSQNEEIISFCKIVSASNFNLTFCSNGYKDFDFLPFGNISCIIIDSNLLQNLCIMPYWKTLSRIKTIIITSGTVSYIPPDLIDFDILPFPLNKETLQKIITKKIEEYSFSLFNLSVSDNYSIAKNDAIFHPLFTHLLGESKKMVELKKVILNASKTTSSLLFLGESGTGKTVASKIVHELSSRKSFPFVILNMAIIKEEFVETSLFGTVRGAYTGATARDGFFSTANKGTLFLDEIGEMKSECQAKLLRVLETGLYRNVGSDEEKQADVRLLFATNVNIQKMIKNKTFREDLYWRIADFPIYFPPLRERKEDIPLLVNNFLQDTEKIISPLALEKMQEHDWPGNIRELKSCVKRACFSSKDELITPSSIILNPSI